MSIENNYERLSAIVEQQGDGDPCGTATVLLQIKIESSSPADGVRRVMAVLRDGEPLYAYANVSWVGDQEGDPILEKPFNVCLRGPALINAHAALVAQCHGIVALAGGWDDQCTTGPREPLSWETVGRMAIDYARVALICAYDLPPDTTPLQLRQVRDGVLVWRGDHWEMPPSPGS